LVKAASFIKANLRADAMPLKTEEKEQFEYCYGMMFISSQNSCKNPPPGVNMIKVLYLYIIIMYENRIMKPIKNCFQKGER
jgi:hypothetical protein